MERNTYKLRKSLSHRSPVSSDSEAIYVNELNPYLVEGYISALLASGFKREGNAFTPCPLGTFTDLSAEEVGGCQNCPPGNL